MKKLTTTQRKARGNPGGKIITPEPDYTRAIPEAPKHLSTVAKKEFGRIANYLHSVGLLTDGDAPALAIYCDWWEQWIDAKKHIEKEGRMVRTPNGYEVQSPWVNLANKSKEQMHKLLAEFGLTPKARKQVEKIEDTQTKAIAKYIGG